MLATTILSRPVSAEFARMSREMDRLFQNFAPMTGGVERAKGLGSTPVNLWQDEANLYAEAELPGVSPDDVEILAQGDSLTIKGSRRVTHDERTTGVIRAERLSGAFERTLALPVEVDAERVTAALRDGVLTITLPKAQAALPRRIAVSAG